MNISFFLLYKYVKISRYLFGFLNKPHYLIAFFSVFVGMHMGYNDDRRFPDFTFVSGDEPLTDYLDAVIISHFHLDHCGALPFMTEMVGYNGPIYMTGMQCIRGAVVIR